jgi:hypothetical protein
MSVEATYLLRKLEQLAKLAQLSYGPQVLQIKIAFRKVDFTLFDRFGQVRTYIREAHIEEPRAGEIFLDFGPFLSTLHSFFYKPTTVTFKITSNQLYIVTQENRVLTFQGRDPVASDGFEVLNITRTAQFTKFISQLAWLIENIGPNSKVNILADNNHFRAYSRTNEMEIGFSFPGIMFDGQYMTTFNEDGIEILRRFTQVATIPNKGNIIFTNRGIGLEASHTRFILDVDYYAVEPLNLSLVPKAAAKFENIPTTGILSKTVELIITDNPAQAKLRCPHVTYAGKHAAGSFETAIPSSIFYLFADNQPLIISVVDTSMGELLLFRQSGRYLAIRTDSEILRNPELSFSYVNVKRLRIKRSKKQ